MNATFKIQNPEFRAAPSGHWLLAPGHWLLAPGSRPTSSFEPGTSSSPRQRSRRRGVVLLIVVSLLALFVLLGVTYTLAVNQYLSASKLDILDQQKGDPPE